MCMDTFRLLKKDPLLNVGQDEKKNLIKEDLTKKVDTLMRQRQEFHDQIAEHERQKGRELENKKAMQRQYNEIWKKQIE